jgi:hypothetical protein
MLMILLFNLNKNKIILFLKWSEKVVKKPKIIKFDISQNFNMQIVLSNLDMSLELQFLRFESKLLTPLYF